MAQTGEHSEQLAIVGGGITGLTAALRALENGQDPASITIYEATNRFGGKIQSSQLADGTLVNMGAEFIDSEHTRLIALCEQLGVKLNATADQGSELFQRPDGGVMQGAQFHAAYEPLAARIRADKAAVAADPNGPLAQRINSMSLADYLNELRTHTPAQASPSLFTRIAQFFSGHGNRVDPAITKMAALAFSSEMGRAPRDINALQFLHEASAERGSFLDSDCAFRVEGGTERIINALEQKLQEKGVRFEKGAPVQRIEKSADGIAITRAGQEPVRAGKLVLALPAYALGSIEGLETVGMHPQLRDMIAGVQYTNSVKFTVKLQPGMQAPQSNFFAAGMQVWSSGQGEMTFLVNADSLQQMSARNLVDRSLNEYARSFGSTPELMFDARPGNIVFNNPGKNACYASPRPGEARKLEQLEGALAGMAEHGVAVAGTYLPVQTENGIALGFMECGVASSQRAVDQLIAPQRARPQWLEQTLAQQPAAAQQSHAAALAARQTAAQQAGQTL